MEAGLGVGELHLGCLRWLALRLGSPQPPEAAGSRTAQQWPGRLQSRSALWPKNQPTLPSPAALFGAERLKSSQSPEMENAKIGVANYVAR